MIKLNLLPPDIKEEINFSKKNARIYQYLVRGIAIMAAIFGLMFVIGFIAWNNQILASEARSDAYIQLSKYSDTEAKATDINSRLGLINKLKKDRVSWDKVLTELGNNVPTTVHLINFSFVNVGADRITISGFAPSSAEVGTFRDSLSKSALFQYIDIESMVSGNDPLDASRHGVTFKITLTLNVAEAKKW